MAQSLHPRIFRPWIVSSLLALLAGTASAQVGGIAPKFLLDPVAPAAAGQIVPTDAQATFTLGKDGITVSIAPGAAQWPGLGVTPEAKAPWDLSPWGHIEARLTNLGAERISVGMRVDNAGDWRKEPWNAENLTLNPKESKIVKVIFGHSYGFQPAFKLNSGAVIQVLFIANGKSDKPRAFRIEDLQASGSSGEKPPVDPSTARAKPAGGVLYAPAMKLEAAKQLVAKGGAKAGVVEGGIQIEFAGGPKPEQVIFQPAVGSWQLTDCLQVTVKLTNAGDAPVTPKFRLESKGGASDTVAAPGPIPPGGTATVILPFTPAVSPVIPTDPRQTVSGPGSWSEQNWGPKPGTGTVFTSPWAKGVTIFSDTTAGAKRLLITGITAGVPDQPKLPDWLGKRPPVEGDWSKTFEENFDGPTLDLKTWNIYTANYWDKRTHFSKDNAYIKNGCLVLHYEKKTGPHNDDPNDPTKTVGTTDYACGFADTFTKWTQRYGYFEARVKLPKAPGLWPAFWTMPDRGPEAGVWWKRASTANGGIEHDILEYLSGWGPYRYNLAFHWDGYGKEHKSAGTSINYVQPDRDGFITTGVYWTPGLAVYYSQGREVLRWESPRVSSVPAYIMFNMVSGGWDNLPLDDAQLPDDFVIDYVRVWQRKDLASPADGPKPNLGLPSSINALLEEERLEKERQEKTAK